MPYHPPTDATLYGISTLLTRRQLTHGLPLILFWGLCRLAHFIPRLSIKAGNASLLHDYRACLLAALGPRPIRLLLLSFT